jgi:TIR domain
MSTFDSPGRRRIFLSYRRDEASAVAGRLYDRLVDRFGSTAIFMDVSSIEIGQNFAKAIEQAVVSSQVMLVLIGSEWATIAGYQGRRRLDDPNDFIRLEIEAAFEHDLRVIPVLIDNARMPRPQDLPGSLKELVYRQAVGIQLHRDRFQGDVEHLIDTLESYFQSTAATRRPHPAEQEYISPPPERRLIFVSYSHSDDYWLGRLQIHLKPLVRRGRIEAWDDTQIQVGDEWRNEIRKAVENCSAAVLLISADFMASDFIDNNELPPLLEAATQRGVRIFQVLVSSSYFEDSELSRFQAVNSPSKPLDMVVKGEQEAVFAKLQKAIRSVLS